MSDIFETIATLAFYGLESSYNHYRFCVTSDAWYRSAVCGTVGFWGSIAFLTYMVFIPLALIGLVVMPFAAIAEFFVRKRSFLLSARAAVISAMYSLLLFIPYIMIKIEDEKCFKLVRSLFYIYIHLFWMFGSGMVWIYCLANTKFVFYGSEIARYPQRSNEEVQTLLALIMLSITCCYSLVYLWRAHRAGMIHSFSILPLVFAIVWLLIGLLDYLSIEEVSNNPGFIEQKSQHRYVYYRGTASYYQWAIPLTLASFAWIAYTSIKLRRWKRDADTTEPQPRSTHPDAGHGAW